MCKIRPLYLEGKNGECSLGWHLEASLLTDMWERHQCIQVQCACPSFQGDSGKDVHLYLDDSPPLLNVSLMLPGQFYFMIIRERNELHLSICLWSWLHLAFKATLRGQGLWSVGHGQMDFGAGCGPYRRLWTLWAVVQEWGQNTELGGHVWTGEPLWREAQVSRKVPAPYWRKKRTVWPPPDWVSITSPQSQHKYPVNLPLWEGESQWVSPAFPTGRNAAKGTHLQLSQHPGHWLGSSMTGRRGQIGRAAYKIPGGHEGSWFQLIASLVPSGSQLMSLGKISPPNPLNCPMCIPSTPCAKPHLTHSGSSLSEIPRTGAESWTRLPIKVKPQTWIVVPPPGRHRKGDPQSLYVEKTLRVKNSARRKLGAGVCMQVWENLRIWQNWWKVFLPWRHLVKLRGSERESRSVMSNSLPPHGL